MYRQGDFFKHKKHKDICYEYIKSYGPYNGKMKVTVNIWNMGYVDSFVIFRKQKLKIDNDKLRSEYLWLNRESPPGCLREGEWK